MKVYVVTKEFEDYFGGMYIQTFKTKELAFEYCSERLNVYDVLEVDVDNGTEKNIAHYNLGEQE